MKAPGRNIEIEYWTFPDGTDFENFDDFVDEIDKDYFLTVSKLGLTRLVADFMIL